MHHGPAYDDTFDASFMTLEQQLVACSSTHQFGSASPVPVISCTYNSSMATKVCLLVLLALGSMHLAQGNSKCEKLG
jgi:hypothetical protein